MPENPSYNSTHPKWRSTELDRLDCTPGIKAIEARERNLIGTFTAQAGRVLGVGECVSLVRVRAGAEVLDAKLHWTAGTQSFVAVGDPFCCGRILGPVRTGIASGLQVAASCGNAYGTCGILQKYGTTGDGCGLGYVYTCGTDIVLTNLYNAGNAYQDGGAGAYTADGSNVGVAISAGSFRLVLRVREP